MTQRRPTFEFESIERKGAELVPQFWLTDLNDVQERVYLMLLSMWTFEDGALRVYPSIVAGVDQGTEIDLKLLTERTADELRGYSYTTDRQKEVDDVIELLDRLADKV